MKIIKSSILIFCLVVTASNFASSLKKVLVLDIINIDKVSSYQYLEASITDTIRNDLKRQFAFKEIQKKKWQFVADENYIFRNDFYTKTAALNLGLLTKQDIVVYGGFRIVKTKDKVKIRTQIKILSVNKKQNIASIKKTVYADATIFASIKQIASNLSNKARSILPSKDDFEKSGIAEDNSPIFDDYSMGLRVGGGFFASGWASHLKMEQPALSLHFQASIPIIWQRLYIRPSLIYLKHGIKPEADTIINRLNLNTVATNFILGSSFLISLSISKSIYIYPLIGGGMVLQQYNISGNYNANSNNSFLFATSGLELGYQLNRYLELSFTSMVLAEFENNKITYLSLFNLGINYAF